MMHRRQRGGTGVVLLLMQLFSLGSDYLPPVTFGVVIFCLLLFMEVLTPFLGHFFSISFACISLAGILIPCYHWLPEVVQQSTFFSAVAQSAQRGERNTPAIVRLALSPYFHVDDMHLYYNMMSFMWKARSIELQQGSEFLLVLIFFATFATTLMYTMIAAAFLFCVTSGVLSGDSALVQWMSPLSCSVGLSGIIFFLKTILTLRGEAYGTYQHVPYVPFAVQSKYAVWVELIITQLLMPNISFMGHLSGIVVGVLFVKCPWVERRLQYAGRMLREKRQEWTRE